MKIFCEVQYVALQKNEVDDAILFEKTENDVRHRSSLFRIGFLRGWLEVGNGWIWLARIKNYVQYIPTRARQHTREKPAVFQCIVLSSFYDVAWIEAD